MTVTVNGTSHHVTPGDDLQSCVRARPEAEDGPIPGVDALGATHAGAHARAITDQDDVASDQPATKGRNFASPHLAEARAAVAGSWLFQESPPPCAQMWRQVAPAKGEASNPAAWLGLTAVGVFRASVITACWLLALAVAGDIRPDGRRGRTRAAGALTLTVLGVAASMLLTH